MKTKTKQGRQKKTMFFVVACSFLKVCFVCQTGISIIVIAPRLLPFGGHPGVGSGPKLVEMNSS